MPTFNEMWQKMFDPLNEQTLCATMLKTMSHFCMHFETRVGDMGYYSF
jgi:hypothetical protein